MSKQELKDKFIEKAKKVHNRYDYSQDFKK